MHIIILILILVVLIIIAQKQPKAALMLAGFLAVAALLVVLFTATDNFRGQAITPAQIEIVNPSMRQTYAGGYTLTARLINNNADMALKTAVMSVKMLDCPNTQIDDNCVIVGHVNERIDDIVPAGQARDIDETLHFGKVTIENNLLWQYDITETKN